MAHLLPHLIAPVDREHFLRFLGICSVPSSAEKQWALFKKIHCDFCYPVASDKNFLKEAKVWLNKKDYAWDTSILKIVDNLVIGALGSAQSD